MNEVKGKDLLVICFKRFFATLRMTKTNFIVIYEKIQEIGYLPELRKRTKVLPSHWWWYMDKFIIVGEKHSKKADIAAG